MKKALFSGPILMVLMVMGLLVQGSAPAGAATYGLTGYNSVNICGATASVGFFGGWQGSGLNIQTAHVWGTTHGDLLIPKICAPSSISETEDIQVRAFLFGTSKITWSLGTNTYVSSVTYFGNYTTHIRHNIPCIRQQPTNPRYWSYWLYTCKRTVVSPGYQYQVQDGLFVGGVTSVRERADLNLHFTYRGPIDLPEETIVS